MNIYFHILIPMAQTESYFRTGIGKSERAQLSLMVYH